MGLHPALLLFAIPVALMFSALFSDKRRELKAGLALLTMLAIGLFAF